MMKKLKTIQSQNQKKLKKQNLRSHLIKFFSAIILTTILPFSSVFAIEEPAPIIPPLEISPVNRRVSLDPEQKKTGTLEIKNYGNESLKIKVYASPFSNADGIRNFEKESYYTKLSHWIKIKDNLDVYQNSAEFTIEPKKTKTISYKITVPKDAPAGGQYATILVETIADKKDNEDLITTTRVGMLIYATISGDIKSEGEVYDIKSNPFITDEKLNVNYTVENTGNIDFQTSTNIQIFSLFGKQLYADTSIATILPESSEKIKAEWENTPAFGVYKLSYKIRYLDQIIEKSQIIIVTPRIVLFIFLLLSMGAIVLIAYRIRLRATRHKKAT